MAEQTLRASEINQFVYCNRAWWYARQGLPSSNLDMQLQGTQWHQRHGQTVLSAGCIRFLGYAFLLAAVVAAAAYLTTLIMS